MQEAKEILSGSHSGLDLFLEEVNGDLLDSKIIEIADRSYPFGSLGLRVETLEGGLIAKGLVPERAHCLAERIIRLMRGKYRIIVGLQGAATH